MEVKYPLITTEYSSPEKYKGLKKAFHIYNKYREQFSNKNWRYMWLEWFWIVAYAKSENIGKTRRMLHALDGKEGIISTRHIRNRIEPVINFWEDLIEYAPYFREFLQKELSLIKNDPELNQEYKKMVLEGNQKENDNIIIDIVDNHFRRFNSSSKNGSNSHKYGEDEAINKRFEIIRTRPDRIRIYHSNPNYRNEIEDYKNNKGLNREKPKKRQVCGPFALSELPAHIIAQLCIQGRLKLGF